MCTGSRRASVGRSGARASTQELGLLRRGPVVFNFSPGQLTNDRWSFEPLELFWAASLAKF